MTRAARAGAAPGELEREVQWYPGHMAKALRRIRDYLAAIDVVVEVVDARVPRSGRSPVLDALASNRPRIVAFTRDDLADPLTTKRWLAALTARGAHAIALDGRMRRSVSRIAGTIERARGAKKGIVRAMIVGLPNSGKSSIVNALVGRAAARTEDRAGVTRQLQWFRLSPGVELMDTPGVLPPKIARAGAQWKLAICGAVPPERYEPEEVVEAFHHWLVENGRNADVPDLQAFAAARGFVRRGGRPDYHNAARSYVSAFNAGAFGRISLEAPDDPEAT